MLQISTSAQVSFSCWVAIHDEMSGRHAENVQMSVWGRKEENELGIISIAVAEKLMEDMTSLSLVGYQWRRICMKIMWIYSLLAHDMNFRDSWTGKITKTNKVIVYLLIWCSSSSLDICMHFVLILIGVRCDFMLCSSVWWMMAVWQIL